MQELSKAKAIIFACTDRSEKECLDRSLFSTNKLYSENALATRKGDLLFLYNMDKDVLRGVFEAISDGSKDIEPDAWNGNYPYQVRVKLRGQLNSIPKAKQLLSKLGVDRHYPLGLNRTKLLLKFFETPGEVKWGDLSVEAPVEELEQQQALVKPRPEATTLWDYPRQSYGITRKGDNKYAGVTPAFIIYNLLFRYTEKGDLVVDPMAGSGTTLDVCKEEGRRCIAYDIKPPRKDIMQLDSRKLPLPDNSVDLIFVDSPYGDNIRYNDHPDNIGNISAERQEFYDELEKVISECSRILKPGKKLGWLIGDQWVKKKFTPVGFTVYQRLCKYFETEDIISVVRRSQSSNTGVWYNRAIRLNFFLRGFKYLFIMSKPEANNSTPKNRSVKWNYYERKRRH